MFALAPHLVYLRKFETEGRRAIWLAPIVSYSFLFIFI